MNKTVNINLAGIFFHIDEDAYLKLQRYLEAIKRSFTDSQGQSEIISDIEARISELFSERIQNEKQVVGVKLVDEVITIMGQPEDYLVDDEIFEDEPRQKHRSKSKPTKKLFRDTDNSYVGGVAAGVGHYFGIETLWVRLIWVLLIFGAGTGVLLYIILWALVPEARTTAEKITMSGDPVNISNIEKKIKDGIDNVTEAVKNVDIKKHSDKIKDTIEDVTDNITDTVKNVDFKKKGNKLKSSSQSFFDSIGSILLFFLKVVSKFIGIILIITGISALIALIVGLIGLAVTDTMSLPGVDFVEAANLANTPMWLIALLTFFAVGIPFFFIFYLGLKILVNNLKSIGNIAKFSLFGIWLMAVIGLTIIGLKQATERAFDAKVTQKEVINIKANDTVVLKMKDFFTNDYYTNYHDSRYNGAIYEDDYGKHIKSSRIRLIVRSTRDSMAYLLIDKKASGSNFKIAKQRAENINYKYELSNGELQLGKYLNTDLSNKFSEQKIQVILYLPVGTVLYADDNTHWYHQNTSYYNDILDSGMEEHYLKIVNDGVECIDCGDKNDETSSKSKTKKIAPEEEVEKEKHKDDGKIKVTIDDKDGVDITVDNDN